MLFNVGQTTTFVMTVESYNCVYFYTVKIGIKSKEAECIKIDRSFVSFLKDETRGAE